MPFRLRKSVAVLCLAIAVFAVATPAIAVDSPLAIITAHWQLVPPATLTPLATGDVELGQEQLLGYHSLVPSRAPPVS
jgi:hypothetical protein